MISRKFRDYVGKGNAIFAIKLFYNDMEGGTLPSDKEMKGLLKLKHPERKEAMKTLNSKVHYKLLEI